MNKQLQSNRKAGAKQAQSKRNTSVLPVTKAARVRDYKPKVNT